ncbi:hypothetical protein STEG23_028678 [Scotinomys teguina]
MPWGGGDCKLSALCLLVESIGCLERGNVILASIDERAFHDRKRPGEVPGRLRICTKPRRKISVHFRNRLYLPGPLPKAFSGNDIFDGKAPVLENDAVHQDHKDLAFSVMAS